MENEKKELIVKIMPNGPAIIQGEVRVILPDGSEEVKKPVALCRCGKSKNQPYCDGSHAK